jgi:hypothetical protein
MITPRSTHRQLGVSLGEYMPWPTNEPGDVAVLTACIADGIGATARILGGRPLHG